MGTSRSTTRKRSWNDRLMSIALADCVQMLISALDQIEHCLDAVDGSRVVQLRVPLLGIISISRSATNFPPLANPTVPFWAIPPIMSSETLGIDEGIWDWPTDLNTLDDELSFWAVDTSLPGNPSNW